MCEGQEERVLMNSSDLGIMLQSVEGGEARSQGRAQGARVCGRVEVISPKSNGLEDEITGTSSPSFGSWSKEAFAWLPYSHLPAEIGSQFPAFMKRHFIELLTAMPSLLSEREEAFLLQMPREDPSSFHISESCGPLHLEYWLVAGTPPPLWYVFQVRRLSWSILNQFALVA